MIRANSVSKYYGGRRALHDVSFDIESREIVGFLGLNGAGKSTVLRILAGLMEPSSGRVTIDGIDFDAGPQVRGRIGFLPDRPPVYEDMSVRDYLRFAARLRGHSGSEARITDVVETTGLREYADTRIEELSHGYRQRVGIAQAIVHDPALVILDEPISGLDPIQIAQMRDLVRSLKDRHTVLLSSHNLPEISQTCDRLMVIQSGELVATGSEADLLNRAEAATSIELELVGGAVALEALHAEGFLESFEALSNDRWTVLSNRAVEEIVARLVQSGVGVRGVALQARALESLFFKLSEKGVRS